MGESWSEAFFDEDYLRVWGGFVTDERTQREAEALWSLLALSPGVTVLDAPCGFGRIARALAGRGASVVGVDRSTVQLREAERLRGDIREDRLRYVQHDLRRPFEGLGSFDVALNLFSSIGYGTEAEDLTVLSNLHTSLRRGGRVVLDTMHRDAVILNHTRNPRPAHRLADGTLVVEEPVFDPVRARIDTVWHWSGPHGSGSKRASLRIYAANELVALMHNAGFRVLAAHAGLTSDLFRGDATVLAGRIAIIAEKP